MLGLRSQKDTGDRGQPTPDHHRSRYPSGTSTSGATVRTTVTIHFFNRGGGGTFPELSVISFVRATVDEQAMTSSLEGG